MQSSKSKGFSALEFIVIFIIVGIIAPFIYYKSFHYKTDDFIARAGVAHLKLMARLVEKQKRELGAYPMSLGAMVDRDEYLHPRGNSKGYTRETELKNQWNGPYLKNHPVYPNPYFRRSARFFKIDLSHIMPGMTGDLRRAFDRDDMLVYSITYEDAPDLFSRMHAVALKAIIRCNGEAIRPIVLRGAREFYTVIGNHITPCGFSSRQKKLTDVTYFISQLS